MLWSLFSTMPFFSKANAMTIFLPKFLRF
jgi:hypothetical protein